MPPLSEMRMPKSRCRRSSICPTWNGKAVAGVAAVEHIGRKSRWRRRRCRRHRRQRGDDGHPPDESIRAEDLQRPRRPARAFHAMRWSDYDEADIDRDDVVVFAAAAACRSPTPRPTAKARRQTTADYPAGSVDGLMKTVSRLRGEHPPAAKRSDPLRPAGPGAGPPYSAMQQTGIADPTSTPTRRPAEGDRAAASLSSVRRSGPAAAVPRASSTRSWNWPGQTRWCHRRLGCGDD